MSLYYECHVTIEPIFDDLLDQAKQLALDNNFKIANLLMQKRKEDTPERSIYDTFMTGHSQNYEQLEHRMISLIADLHKNNFKVWRYKIESIIIDSRINDSLNLLNIP